MDYSANINDFHMSEIPVTSLLNATHYLVHSILFTTNRHRFGIFYKLSGVSEMQNDAGSWIFDQDHVVIIPKAHISSAAEINDENSAVIARIFEAAAAIAIYDAILCRR